MFGLWTDTRHVHHFLLIGVWKTAQESQALQCFCPRSIVCACILRCDHVLELCACSMARRPTWMWPCGSECGKSRAGPHTPDSELMICSTVNISGREHMVLGYNELPLKVKEEYTHMFVLCTCTQKAHAEWTKWTISLIRTWLKQN